MRTEFFPNREKGAVLLVALIVLLLMTIIGISSMRVTSLQERMAGNMRDQNLAFQGAETAMRQAEALVLSKEVNFWQNTSTERSWQSVDNLAGVGKPRFRITPIPGVTIIKPGDSLEAGQAIEVALVRVEAEGYGAAVDTNDSTASSNVLLQSTFIRR
ncbi:PilX N-terminal domain-containing pilus assembly protein [Pseudomonas sp. MAG002Y]|uniref:pilus assembly PilX family protein n=1 Tax=Pseudomonas sp. MAG002Y TaxID=2678690 RepID=UPI001C60ADF0|nr:PilX N-terminal domain-containing pilus assembly protein [Pseudomonas sp. MAG002Y]MBW5411704.1 pilus assembly protein PilX [Pseudomonas sp. MAG002Y]